MNASATSCHVLGCINCKLETVRACQRLFFRRTDNTAGPPADSLEKPWPPDVLIATYEATATHARARARKKGAPLRVLRIPNSNIANGLHDAPKLRFLTGRQFRFFRQSPRCLLFHILADVVAISLNYNSAVKVANSYFYRPAFTKLNNSARVLLLQENC